MAVATTNLSVVCTMTTQLGMVSSMAFAVIGLSLMRVLTCLAARRTLYAYKHWAKILLSLLHLAIATHT